MSALGLMVEAERRGILPPEKAQLLAEARRRGLIDSAIGTPLAEQHAARYDPSVGRGEFAWDKFKRGVVGGVVNIPGYMADLGAVPSRALGRFGVPRFELAGKEPWMSATTQTQRFGDKLLNVERDMLPPDTTSRYLGNVAEFAGSSVLLSGGLIGTAAKKALAAAGEAAAITGGGLASEFGGDVAEDMGVNRAWGAVPLGITGSTLGYAIPGALSKVGAAKTAVDAAMANKAAKQISGIVQAENLGEKITASLDTARHIESVTGIKFTPTLAGRTKSQYIADLEREVLGRNMLSAEKAISTQLDNVGALHRFKDISFPPSTVPLKQSAAQKMRVVTSSLDDAAAKMAAERAVIGAKVTGKAQQATGQSLDDLRIAARATEKAKLSGEIDEIYALGKVRAVDIIEPPTQAAFQSADDFERAMYGDMPETGVLPQRPSAVIDMPGHQETGILAAIRKHGGIEMREIRDLVGERATNRAGVQVGTFRRGGASLDDMTRAMVQQGYLPRSVLDDVDEGVQALRDAIQRQIGLTDDTVSMRAAYEAAYGTPPVQQLARDTLMKRAGQPAPMGVDKVVGRTLGFPESMDDIVDVVKKIAGSDKHAFQNMPPVFGQIHEKYAKGLLLGPSGKPMPASASFEEIHSLYKETNRQLAAARGMTDGTQAYYLGQLKNALQAKLKKFEGPEYGELGQRFAAWNKDYTKYAQTFKEGVGGRMAGGTKYGELLAKDTIVKRFFTPRGIDDFNKIYKSDPVAKQLLEDGILDLFAKQSGIRMTGEINPKLTTTFLKNNAEALNKLPKLKTKLMDSTKATEALINRSAAVAAARKELELGIVARIAKVDDPLPIIQKALTDRKELMSLMAVNAEGRKAALNAISQSIPAAAQKANMTVSEFLLKNESTLKLVLNRYGTDHYKNVKTIADAMDTLVAGRPPVHPSLNQFNVDPIQAWTGTTGPSLVSQYRATQITRQSSPVHMATSMLTRFWMKLNGDNARKMQEYLLTNPEAARDFAAATRLQNPILLSNKLSAHAMAAGVRSITAATDEMMLSGDTAQTAIIGTTLAAQQQEQNNRGLLSQRP